MKETGSECEIAGAYRSVCPHRAELYIEVGETFPECPGGHRAKWVLVNQRLG